MQHGSLYELDTLSQEDEEGNQCLPQRELYDYRRTSRGGVGSLGNTDFRGNQPSSNRESQLELRDNMHSNGRSSREGARPTLDQDFRGNRTSFNRESQLELRDDIQSNSRTPVERGHYPAWAREPRPGPGEANQGYRRASREGVGPYLDQDFLEHQPVHVRHLPTRKKIDNLPKSLS